MDDWALATAGDPEDRTRIKGVVAVDPGRTAGAAGAAAPRRRPCTRAPTRTVGAREPRQHAERRQPAPPARWSRALVLSLVACAVLVVALGHHGDLRAGAGGGQRRHPDRARPLRPGHRASTIVFSWSDPGLQPDDTYQVAVGDQPPSSPARHRVPGRREAGRDRLRDRHGQPRRQDRRSRAARSASETDGRDRLDDRGVARRAQVARRDRDERHGRRRPGDDARGRLGRLQRAAHAAGRRGGLGGERRQEVARPGEHRDRQAQLRRRRHGRSARRRPGRRRTCCWSTGRRTPSRSSTRRRARRARASRCRRASRRCTLAGDHVALLSADDRAALADHGGAARRSSTPAPRRRSTSAAARSRRWTRPACSSPTCPTRGRWSRASTLERRRAVDARPTKVAGDAATAPTSRSPSVGGHWALLDPDRARRSGSTAAPSTCPALLGRGRRPGAAAAVGRPASAVWIATVDRARPRAARRRHADRARSRRPSGAPAAPGRRSAAAPTRPGAAGRPGASCDASGAGQRVDAERTCRPAPRSRSGSTATASCSTTRGPASPGRCRAATRASTTGTSWSPKKTTQELVDQSKQDTPPQYEKQQQPPVAVDDAVRRPAGPGRPRCPVLLNDYDPNGDVLVIDSFTGDPGRAGDPRADQQPTSSCRSPCRTRRRGTIAFDYTISDGRGGTATAHVTVTVRAADRELAAGLRPRRQGGRAVRRPGDAARCSATATTPTATPFFLARRDGRRLPTR